MAPVKDRKSRHKVDVERRRRRLHLMVRLPGVVVDAPLTVREAYALSFKMLQMAGKGRGE